MGAALIAVDRGTTAARAFRLNRAMINPLAGYLEPLPLIAVLRGITPPEIPAIGAALVDQGFRILEAPLSWLRFRKAAGSCRASTRQDC